MKYAARSNAGRFNPTGRSLLSGGCLLALLAPLVVCVRTSRVTNSGRGLMAALSLVVDSQGVETRACDVVLLRDHGICILETMNTGARPRDRQSNDLQSELPSHVISVLNRAGQSDSLNHALTVPRCSKSRNEPYQKNEPGLRLSE